MHRPAYLSVVALLLTLPFVAPSPIARPLPQRRQSVNCTDPDAITSGSCWDALHLADYLINWNQNKPICQTIAGTLEDGAHCCAFNEAWSTCFIRLAIGNHGYNCVNINEGTCPNFQVDASVAPEVRYILSTMYNINNFFYDWNGALPYATLSSLLLNQPLILEIDPVQKTNVILSDLLSALTASLSFVAGPELSGLAGTAADALLTALQSAPSVAKAIWPSGTADSQTEQLANLDSSLLQLDQNFTTQITAGLSAIMTDVPSFTDFAAHGSFSGPNNLSLPSSSNLLALGLRTYILSTAMSANKWTAFPIQGMTMSDIASPVSGYDCTFGPNNICTPNHDGGAPIFYSESTAVAYSLTLTGAGPNGTEFLNEVVEKEWAELELLFDGAWNCSRGPGGSGIGRPLSLFNGTGLDLACLSQLRIGSG